MGAVCLLSISKGVLTLGKERWHRGFSTLPGLSPSLGWTVWLGPPTTRAPGPAHVPLRGSALAARARCGARNPDPPGALLTPPRSRQSARQVCSGWAALVLGRGKGMGDPLWGRPARQRNCFQSRAASVSMATCSAPSARAPAKVLLPTRWPPSSVVIREKDFPPNLGFSPPVPLGWKATGPWFPRWFTRARIPHPPPSKLSSGVRSLLWCPTWSLPTLTQITQKQLACSLSFKKSAICPNSCIKRTCKEQFIIKFAFPSVNAWC